MELLLRMELLEVNCRTIAEIMSMMTDRGTRSVTISNKHHEKVGIKNDFSFAPFAPSSVYDLAGYS